MFAVWQYANIELQLFLKCKKKIKGGSNSQLYCYEKCIRCRVRIRSFVLTWSRFGLTAIIHFLYLFIGLTAILNLIICNAAIFIIIKRVARQRGCTKLILKHLCNGGNSYVCLSQEFHSIKYRNRCHRSSFFICVLFF